MIKLIDVYSGTGVTPGAIEFLYQLLQERPPEANISHAALPSIEQHRQFVHRRPYRYWYVVGLDGGERVGALYATNLNEIGIAVAKAHRRAGYAREAITEFKLLHEPMPAEPSVRRGTWIANVAPYNEPSRTLFEHLGGKLIQVTYELP